MNDINPYSEASVVTAAELAATSSDLRSRVEWRLIPAILCYLGSAAAFTLTVMVLVRLTIWRPQYIDNHWVMEGIFILVTSACIATMFYLAGLMFWRRRYVWGIVSILSGIGCFLVAYSIADLI